LGTLAGVIINYLPPKTRHGRKQAKNRQKHPPKTLGFSRVFDNTTQFHNRDTPIFSIQYCSDTPIPILPENGCSQQTPLFIGLTRPYTPFQSFRGIATAWGKTIIYSQNPLFGDFRINLSSQQTDFKKVKMPVSVPLFCV
jgi:hypothetical protein